MLIEKHKVIWLCYLVGGFYRPEVEKACPLKSTKSFDYVTHQYTTEVLDGLSRIWGGWFLQAWSRETMLIKKHKVIWLCADELYFLMKSLLRFERGWGNSQIPLLASPWGDANSGIQGGGGLRIAQSNSLRMLNGNRSDFLICEQIKEQRLNLSRS